MSVVEAKEAMAEQEMRNNEEVFLMEPVVVHGDPNDDEGADDDNDDPSTGSEDTALAADVQPKDMVEAESQPEPESQLADNKASYILNLMPDGRSAGQN
eukprot:6901951-Ditylum_brightwellii.AAC.1